MTIERMTVKELFSRFSDETCCKISVHDLHWHYLETPDGDSTFYVNKIEPDSNLKTLEKVYDFHVFEWWVHISSGTVHVAVVEDIV